MFAPTQARYLISCFWLRAGRPGHERKLRFIARLSQRSCGINILGHSVSFVLAEGRINPGHCSEAAQHGQEGSGTCERGSWRRPWSASRVPPRASRRTIPVHSFPSKNANDYPHVSKAKRTLVPEPHGGKTAVAHRAAVQVGAGDEALPSAIDVYLPSVSIMIGIQVDPRSQFRPA